MSLQEDVNQIFNLMRAEATAAARNHLETTNRLTAIETKLEDAPPVLKQPCNFLEDHIEEHKAAEKTMKDNVISAGFKLVVVAIVAACTAALTALIKD